jgi:hypothetical protein
MSGKRQDRRIPAPLSSIKCLNILLIQIKGFQDAGISIFHNQFNEPLWSQVFGTEQEETMIYNAVFLLTFSCSHGYAQNFCART